jgi:hypothetical protein
LKNLRIRSISLASSRPTSNSFLGVFSAAQGCRAILTRRATQGCRAIKANPEWESLAQADNKDAGLPGIRDVVETCLAGIPEQPYFAVVSARKFAKELPEGLLPGSTGHCLCRPQEAILAAALGGKPGVVIHSQGAFRAMSVDSRGSLAGLARKEGSPLWLVSRAQFWSDRFQEQAPRDWQSLKIALNSRPNSLAMSSLIAEAVTEMAELLHHLLNRVRTPVPIPITWAGPETPPALVSALRGLMEAQREEIQWIEPVFQEPAIGCVLLAQASSSLDPREYVDDEVWRRLFDELPP